MGLRRYILWTFRCHRGRDCAHLVLVPPSDIPLGAVLIAEYTCSGCGTDYRHPLEVEMPLEQELDEIRR